MLPSQRYPTHEEIELLIARARHMRSVYIGALINTAALRARQYFSAARERRVAAPRRFYPDVA